MPTLTIAGDITVETQNHYSYENFLGYIEEPVYELRPYDHLIGYEPILDEQGNQIGETPIFETRYEEVISYYNYLPYYETVYQTSGGNFRLDTITVNFQVSNIPLPPSSLMFLGGLALATLSAQRRNSA